MGQLKRWVGCDPGLKGAIAMIEGDKVECWDMPTYKVQGTWKTHNYIDGKRLALIFQSLSAGHDVSICLEQVSAMPGSDGRGGRQAIGVTSAFNFGMGYGTIVGVLNALHLTFHEARPAVWKRAMQVNPDKEFSIKMATALYPDAERFLKRKRDDGRAESILLAEYGRIYKGDL